MPLLKTANVMSRNCHFVSVCPKPCKGNTVRCKASPSSCAMQGHIFVRGVTRDGGRHRRTMIKGSTLQPLRCTGVPGSWVVIWCHTSAHLGNPEPSKFCEDRRSINDNTHAQPHDRPENKRRITRAERSAHWPWTSFSGATTGSSTGTISLVLIPSPSSVCIHLGCASCRAPRWEHSQRRCHDDKVYIYLACTFADVGGPQLPLQEAAPFSEFGAAAESATLLASTAG